MEFPGLADDDLGNVRALNRLYLHCLARSPGQADSRDKAAIPLRELIAALNARQLERLASSPFLLFSLREHDADHWEQLIAVEPNGELFTQQPASDADYARLLVASLGFLWQLARRNPYAARVVSGASVYCCETLAKCTLVSLLARVAHRVDLLRPRFADDADVWNKLLSAGVSAKTPIRVAAQLTAMQTMLTQTPGIAPLRLKAAACRMPAPRTR